MSKWQERPWGRWKIVHSGEQTVKIITVNAGQMLSLQQHKHRSESWTPLDDGLIAYTGTWNPEAKVMIRDRMYVIQPGEVHRLINPTQREISIIEIIKGKYDEEDIERLHDNYDRVDTT